MARDDAGREEIPVALAPAELVAKRRHREGGIGRATRNHDVRACGERLHDRHRPDVRVGGNYPITDPDE
jgi:hypothetical protein